MGYKCCVSGCRSGYSPIGSRAETVVPSAPCWTPSPNAAGGRDELGVYGAECGVSSSDPPVGSDCGSVPSTISSQILESNLKRQAWLSPPPTACSASATAAARRAQAPQEPMSKLTRLQSRVHKDNQSAECIRSCELNLPSDTTGAFATKNLEHARKFLGIARDFVQIDRNFSGYNLHADLVDPNLRRCHPQIWQRRRPSLSSPAIRVSDLDTPSPSSRRMPTNDWRHRRGPWNWRGRWIWLMGSWKRSAPGPSRGHLPYGPTLTFLWQKVFKRTTVASGSVT